MSLDWYNKQHLKNSTPEFEKWWVSFYGESTSYDAAEEEQDEYWTRKGFALMGWNARGNVE